jgi:hypothetical protein
MSKKNRKHAAASAIIIDDPAADIQIRDEQGALTREGMEAIIRRGESVMYGGKIISQIEYLPEAAELAVGDAQRESAVMDALDAQEKSIQRQRNLILESRGKGRKTAADTGAGRPVASAISRHGVGQLAGGGLPQVPSHQESTTGSAGSAASALSSASAERSKKKSK